MRQPSFQICNEKRSEGCFLRHGHIDNSFFCQIVQSYTQAQQTLSFFFKVSIIIITFKRLQLFYFINFKKM